MVGSRIVERLGLFLALDYSPAALFVVVVISFRAFPVEDILLVSDRVHEFPASFVYDGCDRFVPEGGDVPYVGCVGELEDCCSKGLGRIGCGWLLGWGVVWLGGAKLLIGCVTYTRERSYLPIV